MKTSLRRILAAAGTATLAGLLVVVGGGAAYGYPAAIADVDIVVFANVNVNDVAPGAEVENETTVLQSFGAASVTQFDGGDGSAAAWAAALTDVELLVIPDPENGDFYLAGGTPWVSEGAFQVIKSWIDAGGYVIANGNYFALPDYEATYGDFLTGLTGKPFAGAPVETQEIAGPFDLATPVAGAPDPIPSLNGTYSLPYGSWSAELQAITTVIYQTPDTAFSPVLTIGVGQGVVQFLGYDWFESAALDNEWAEVLNLAAEGALPFEPQPIYGAAAPALANTGAEISVVPVLVIGCALLLGGVASLVVVRRRTA
jgi:LPXTG-motif cell wall-anchored protein